MLEVPDEELVLPHPGMTARFHLNFTGNPLPEVLWDHVSLTGTLTPIKDTGPDSRYVCFHSHGMHALVYECVVLPLSTLYHIHFWLVPTIIRNGRQSQ